jgi:hypothetical protein
VNAKINAVVAASRRRPCRPGGIRPAGLWGAQILGPRFEDYTPLAFAGLLKSPPRFGFQAPGLATDVNA